MSHLVSYFYDQAAVPTNPAMGQTWRERDSNNLIVCEWFWSGTFWLSTRLHQQNVCAWSGQGIIIGGVIGEVSSTTENIPFSQGNNHDIFLYKIHGMFRVSGMLSSANYWELQFRSPMSKLQGLNITAGNGGETTNYICKSSDPINTRYTKLSTGFNIAFAKNGSAPNMRSPIALIEYRWSRS